MKITESKLRKVIRRTIRESQRYGFPLYLYYDGTHYSLSTNHSRKYYETDHDRVAYALRAAKEEGYDEVIRVVGNQEPRKPQPIDKVIESFEGKSIEYAAYRDY